MLGSSTPRIAHPSSSLLTLSFGVTLANLLAVFLHWLDDAVDMEKGLVLDFVGLSEYIQAKVLILRTPLIARSIPIQKPVHLSSKSFSSTPSSSSTNSSPSTSLTSPTQYHQDRPTNCSNPLQTHPDRDRGGRGPFRDGQRIRVWD